MRKIKPVIALLLTLIFLGLPLHFLNAQKLRWQKYSNDEFGFSIKIPGTPEIIPAKFEAHSSLHLSLNLGNGNYFFVSIIKYRGDYNLSETIAEKSIRDFVDVGEGKLLSEIDNWETGGHTGRKAKTWIQKSESTCQINVLASGNRNFQLGYCSMYGDPDPKIAQKFFNSFKIVTE